MLINYSKSSESTKMNDFSSSFFLSSFSAIAYGIVRFYFYLSSCKHKEKGKYLLIKVSAATLVSHKLCYFFISLYRFRFYVLFVCFFFYLNVIFGEMIRFFFLHNVEIDETDFFFLNLTFCFYFIFGLF